MGEGKAVAAKVGDGATEGWSELVDIGAFGVVDEVMAGAVT